jgi:hypothetical protein
MEIMNFETKALKLKTSIQRQLSDWYDTYNVDQWLRKSLTANATLSGSAISSIYHGEPINDWDFYLKDWIMIDNFKEIFKQDQKCLEMIDNWNAYEDNTDIPLIDGKAYTERAITLKNKFQIIIMGTLDQMRPTFDFVHCMPYYDLNSRVLHISEKQMYSIENKMLMMNPQRQSEVTVARIQKFEKRGWKTDLLLKADLTKTLELV